MEILMGFEVFDDGWPTFDCLLNLLTLMGIFWEFFTQKLMTAVQFAFFIVQNLGLSPWDEFALSNCLRINK